jgi:hypothetical protein
MGGLAFDVDEPHRKSWAGYQSDAFSTDHALGVIAPPGLTLQFLLGDLTVMGSGGFGTPNRNIDLVYPGAMVVPPPTAMDFDLGNQTRGVPIAHQFAISGGELPIRWSNLQVTSPGYIASAPTLSPEGMLQWDSTGSAFGTYHFDVTAINNGGSDVGRVSVNVRPVPPQVLDGDLGDKRQGSYIHHNFKTSTGDGPITWEDLVVNSPAPLVNPPSLSSSGHLVWDSAGSPPGLYHFEVTASNGGGSDSGRLSVNLPPIAPYVHDSSIEAEPNEIINYTLTARDPDTPMTELIWSDITFVGLDVAIQPQFDAATQTFTWNTAGSPAGVYDFRVTATDLHGGADFGRLHIGLGLPLDDDYTSGDDADSPTFPGGDPEVPEPTTMSLLGAAVIVLFGRRFAGLNQHRRIC